MENNPVPEQSSEPVVVSAPVITDTPIVQQPINGQTSGLKQKKRRFDFIFKHPIIFALTALLILLLIIAGSVLLSIRHELNAVSGNNAKLVKVTIAPGSTPADIGSLLEKSHVIRSSNAFELYTRFSHTQNELQAGTYRLSPGDTVQAIVQHLVKGTVDVFSITFLPGATLDENKKVLLNAGYSTKEIEDALSATYISPLFDSKPATADLEGYIYGETYNFSSGASVGDILNKTFEQFETVIKNNNLVAGFSKQGLNLYQGITLASIIQREVHDPTDQKQVAQVFYLRLAQDIPLGSDVTFIYAATKLGVTATPSLDSPYNTRIVTGLPPGPISVPGLGALEATANPASGSYVYFLSGDDGKTYFATTEAEHEANITNYCKVKCS